MLLACTMLSASLAVGVPSALATADLTVDEARAHLLAQLNGARTARGINPVQVDPRVQEIAQARSDDMATNHYFAHLAHDKWMAMFTSRGVAFSKIGEILTLNYLAQLADSADSAVSGWRNSTAHWDIVTDPVYNYAGVGVAWDTSRAAWIWTVEFAAEKRPPGFVAPTASFTNAAVLPYSTTHARLSVAWSGIAGTFAVHSYRLQYRINGGTWQGLMWWSSKTTKSVLAPHGKKVEFRVRARDASLNVGAWTLSGLLNS